MQCHVSGDAYYMVTYLSYDHEKNSFDCVEIIVITYYSLLLLF